MSIILPYKGVWPRIAEDAYIAPTAVIAGDVTIGSQASVWFNAVIRGDTAPITIGARANIQDGCVMHADIGMPCVVGADCSIGHNVIVHGATVGDGVLIGMGATLLTGAVVEDGCIVAACSLVAEGKRIPAGQLALGVPAKVVRAVTDAERER
ncbi:MAG TPA: gamma carbonic anhydrase family protein, partial [Ktedonobacterales bacterium]|nr:gamma carbonic anhydrase family protein [Ktedonobacterales bacterium]